MSKLGIGIYGSNGHQITHHVLNHPYAKLVAIAGIEQAKLHPDVLAKKDVKMLASLDELLADKDVDLVSLCSPRRETQAAEAIAALKAGKHVYAEKPCALNEKEIDAIIATAKSTGKQFHEMAGSAFMHPYLAIREKIAAGAIGKVVQIIAQKSYPYFDTRPQDEKIDGGLTCQSAVHATRWIEHAAFQRVTEVTCYETKYNNPNPKGELRIASTFIMKLQEGGLATVTANYLNQKGTGVWGYESLRIFGSLGIIESDHGGKITRLVIGDKDHGPLDVSGPAPDFFEMIAKSILGLGKMPITLEEELHPTRVVLRAKASATK